MLPARHPVQVVVAYDFSPSSEHALVRAIEVAARAPQHVLHIVIALEALGATYNTAEELHDAVMTRVRVAFAGRKAEADVQFYVHARIGAPATEILMVAEEVGADMIFIGTHNKTGVERFLLGSVSERVVREAGCPVIVSRPKIYADVELLKVERYEHARMPFRVPHAYTYTTNQVITRPKDWPLG